jgi:hypothetical protein
VAVSDGPFQFDRPRWKWLLETMKLEGRPVLDLDKPAHKKMYENLLGFNDMEYRASILERYDKTMTAITDDNMVVEWKDPWRYPHPED